MERCVCKSLRVPWAAGDWVQFSLSSARDAWALSPYRGLPRMWPAGCYSNRAVLERSRRPPSCFNFSSYCGRDPQAQLELIDEENHARTCGQERDSVNETNCAMVNSRFMPVATRQGNQQRRVQVVGLYPPRSGRLETTQPRTPSASSTLAY